MMAMLNNIVLYLQLGIVVQLDFLHLVVMCVLFTYYITDVLLHSTALGALFPFFSFFFFTLAQVQCN